MKPKLKTNRRPIPQKDFTFKNEPFALVLQTTEATVRKDAPTRKVRTVEQMGHDLFPV